ncbi:MAG: FkbM family methyltransferase [Hyphomicrobiaceae bacterium]|nr:MAG: FkbM family methyltransferase [Hyphomicrobiaceae bacterium]
MDHLRRSGYSLKTIVDVGAFRGKWAMAVGRVFPESRIIMVEAQEENRGFLDAAVAELGTRATYEIALLGAEEKVSVPFYSLGSGSSIYAEMTSHGLAAATVNKSMTTLSAVLGKLDASNPDFIKLDVQGAEIEVMKGAMQALETATLLQAELSVTPYNAGAPLAADVIEFMGDLGFGLYDLFGLVRAGDREQISQFDALFLSHRRRKR